MAEPMKHAAAPLDCSDWHWVRTVAILKLSQILHSRPPCRPGHERCGADPVPVSDRGDINAMAAAWIQWASENGYRPQSRHRTVPSLRNHSCGFERCQHGSLEPDMEKIAIYAAGYSFRHVARQLPNGNWTSKLGRLEDIEHESLDAICGEEYGKVVIFMQRRRGSALGAHL